MKEFHLYIVQLSTYSKPIFVKYHNILETRHKKNRFSRGSDMDQYKRGFTATGDGRKLEISDLESRGIMLSVERKQTH